MTKKHYKKLYCYVDETGQDTLGRFFIVVVVLIADDHDQLIEQLIAIEKNTGKGLRKWTTSKKNFSYIRQALNLAALKGAVYYSIDRETYGYDRQTLQTIIDAVLTFTKKSKLSKFRVNVLVDGLKPKQEHEYATTLRRHGITTEKVRGVRDQSDALIRLCDTIAGLVRESEEGLADYKRIKKRLERAKIITILD